MFLAAVLKRYLEVQMNVSTLLAFGIFAEFKAGILASHVLIL